jgi:hypothetical protein
MLIKNVKLTNLRNEEHFQFQSEFNDLVIRFTSETLGIEFAYATYEPLYINEKTALDVIRKSDITPAISTADHKRDSTYRGFCDTNQGAQNHFLPAKREAANRIEIAIEHYGNINGKTYDEQTAAINSLVEDLNTDYAADVATLGIADWITELQANNDSFEALMDQRYSKEADRTELKMKDVRLEVDAAYRTITERIDALAIVNGEESYKPFVKELNKRIERYNNTLALRQGRKAKPEAAEA